MEAKETFGKRLRELRTAKALTLIEVARRSNISSSYLREIESGSRQPPPADTVYRIINSLAVDDETRMELVELAKRGRLSMAGF